jgi:hypothetical protein
MTQRRMPKETNSDVETYNQLRPDRLYVNLERYGGDTKGVYSKAAPVSYHNRVTNVGTTIFGFNGTVTSTASATLTEPRFVAATDEQFRASFRYGSGTWAGADVTRSITGDALPSIVYAPLNGNEYFEKGVTEDAGVFLDTTETTNLSRTLTNPNIDDVFMRYDQAGQSFTAGVNPRKGFFVSSGNITLYQRIAVTQGTFSTLRASLDLYTANFTFV